MQNVTLQINLCHRDIDYAEMTIPYLVEAHHGHLDEKIAIVDCCQQQESCFVYLGGKQPETVLRNRVKKICKIAEEFKNKGYFDRIIYFYPETAVIKKLHRKYLGGIITETHDWRGVALTAYLLGLDSCQTRYVLHYDADMLLYQAEGYDWIIEARNNLEGEAYAVAAGPRESPPITDRTFKNRPVVNGAWNHAWISARCFLMDLERLSNYLPLCRRFYFMEVLLRKYLRRNYPPFFEMMLFRRIRKSGGFKLYLKSKKAWLLHPGIKSNRYVTLLPQILKMIKDGHIPDEQIGKHEINETTLIAWENFLKK